MCPRKCLAPPPPPPRVCLLMPVTPYKAGMTPPSWNLILPAMMVLWRAHTDPRTNRFGSVLSGLLQNPRKQPTLPRTSSPVSLLPSSHLYACTLWARHQKRKQRTCLCSSSPHVISHPHCLCPVSFHNLPDCCSCTKEHTGYGNDYLQRRHIFKCFLQWS